MDDMPEVRNRLAEALAIRGMKQVELAEMTGLSKAQINSWKNNRWQPRQTPLFLMAKALDVSEMWLAGYDIPMERPLEQKKADELAELLKAIRENEKLKELTLILKSLTPEQIDQIEPILKMYAEANKKKS